MHAIGGKVHLWQPGLGLHRLPSSSGGLGSALPAAAVTPDEQTATSGNRLSGYASYCEDWSTLLLLLLLLLIFVAQTMVISLVTLWLLIVV